MAEQRATGTPADQLPPPLDRRLERFVERYVHSPSGLEVFLTVAARPSRFYSLQDLYSFTDTPVSQLESVVFQLEHQGLVVVKRNSGISSVGLSRSPAVREAALRLFRYASRPGGRSLLAGIARRRA
jgi:hypothetical protein